MLIWMRERKTLVAKFFVYPLIFVFIALYGSSQFSQQRAMDQLTALWVNGERVSSAEYQSVSQEVSRALSDTIVRPEKSQAQITLEEVVQRELARQLAMELRLRTDDNQVKTFVNQQMTGGRGGALNPAAVRAYLRQLGFEDMGSYLNFMRSRMDIQLALGYVGGTAVPSEEDLQRAMKRQREARTIEMLFFNAENSRPEVQASTDEVREYFTQHAERYRFTKRMKIDYIEAQVADYVAQATPERENLERWFNSNQEKFLVPVERTAATLAFPAKEFRSRVTFTEEDLKNFYEAEKASYLEPEKFKARFVSVSVEVPDASIEAEIAKNPDNFKSENEAVGARHILLRSTPDMTDAQKEETRLKLEAVRGRVTTEEAFIQEAKELSEDPGSKAEGGDLGYFERGRMVPEFESAAFSVSPGSMSAPIASPFGYHLIWVYAKRQAGDPISLREARAKLGGQIDVNPTKDAARKKLESFREAAAGKSLVSMTDTGGLVVQETDWFARGDIPHPDATRDRFIFFQEASKLTPGQVSSVAEGFFRFYVMELVEKQEKRQRTFEEARADVEKAFRSRKAGDFARAQAQEAADKIRAGSLEFDDVSKVYGLPRAVTYENLRNPSGQQREKNASVDREIVNKAFAGDTGTVEGPIDTLQGPVLLSVLHEEPEHLPKLAEVDQEVQTAYRQVVAIDKARQAIWDVWISLDKHHGKLRDSATASGIETKTSDFFEPGSTVPGFRQDSVVNYAAAALRVVGATSSVLDDPPMNVQNPQPPRAYYLLQAATIEESRLPRFEEVAALVRRDLELERADPLVKILADQSAGDISGLLQAATQPFSASRSIDLGSYSREKKLTLLGPASVRLDATIPTLPGENSGADVALTAFQLPLGGVSQVVPVYELPREGPIVVRRPLGYVILQVVEIKQPSASAASRGEAFRALQSALSNASQNDWAHRGRLGAKIEPNERHVPEEVIQELTKDRGKT